MFMGSFAGLSDLVNRTTGGNLGAPEFINVYKSGYVSTPSNPVPTGAAATVVGRWTSLWQYTGIPTDGVTPTGASSVTDNTTPGSLQQTNPPLDGTQKWCLGAIGGGLTTGTLIVYDRLCHSSGLSGALTGAQTTNLPTASLTRFTGGVGNEIWLEIFQAVGNAQVTVTASYTNQSGVSGRTTVPTFIGSAGTQEEQRIIQLSLQQGDTGVKAVASIRLSGSTGTTGNIGVVIVNDLFLVPFPQPAFAWRDLIMGVPAITECVPGACVALAWVAGTTTPPQLMIGFNFVNA